MGVIVLMVFLVSYSDRGGDFTTLLLGSTLCLIGLWIRRLADRRAQRRSSRFRTLRQVMGRNEDPDE
jgi:hypothetical protein